MMKTLADVDKASTGTFVTFADDVMLPEGHFGATAAINGGLIGYLFAGEQDDPKAVLKGRVEYMKEAGQIVKYAFAISDTGETPLGPVTDWRETFAKMV